MRSLENGSNGSGIVPVEGFSSDDVRMLGRFFREELKFKPNGDNGASLTSNGSRPKTEVVTLQTSPDPRVEVKGFDGQVVDVTKGAVSVHNSDDGNQKAVIFVLPSDGDKYTGAIIETKDRSPQITVFKGASSRDTRVTPEVRRVAAAARQLK